MIMQEERLITQCVAADKIGYDFLSGLYDSLIQIQSEDICVDFSECREFDANLSAVMGAFLDKLTENGHNIFLKSPKSA